MDQTNNQTTLVDAVRTVGQLLLHHSTTGAHARDRQGHRVSRFSRHASCFCYVGATSAVSNELRLNWSDLDAACDGVIGYAVSGLEWDSASPRTRKRWATKLANYTVK